MDKKAAELSHIRQVLDSQALINLQKFTARDVISSVPHYNVSSDCQAMVKTFNYSLLSRDTWALQGIYQFHLVLSLLGEAFLFF